jgi:3-hydroxybutyryl-CoA dehydrogenase
MLPSLNPAEEKFDHPVSVVGNGNLTYSIVVCLLRAGYSVDLCTDNAKEAASAIPDYFPPLNNGKGQSAGDEQKLNIYTSVKSVSKADFVIVITGEDLSIKKDTIGQLEKVVAPHAIIGINSESIGLYEIQEGATHPGRIIGLNWTEPVHTTRFLEIITNHDVDEKVEKEINRLAHALNKDPYTVENFGVRSRLMSAMVREAFYLVENGYASVEDIDRACRNDAGYYLPFAGNCRYMDLMGTYAYGMVMKDLNPDLSKEQELPDFFKKIINEGGIGMENGKGLYQYSPEEVKTWKNIFNEFSYQIEEIMNKYPFNYPEKDIA